jgi:arylsulfatase A-like enzyme
MKINSRLAVFPCCVALQAFAEPAKPPGREKPSADKLVAGALVFTPPKTPPTRDDARLWWTWTPGADWQHREGPASNLDGRGNHPLVQVAYDDAVAYAKRADKRLPREAEVVCHKPPGLARSFNPREPHAQQRVTKGSCFLRAENYCLNYRPSARRGTDYDTGMSHIGFRCVLSPDQRDTNTEKPTTKKTKPMKRNLITGGLSLLTASAALLCAIVQVQAADKKPNIVMIMGDDIGIWNIGAYSRGMMAGRTPNLDKLAKGGMLFTDYYAEASCTAGRANFITGELPIRTGLTTVGQAGSPIGMPDAAPTIATALKSMGYATGQFGKNHLGDLNKFLPTVHGFDEFFGYLYHLDAMEDPAHRNYPQALKDVTGPRNMVHSWATDTDDATEQPRWGKIGRQKIEDAGTLYPKRMETVDDEILDLALKFTSKAKADGKPFFLWLNPTRMHVVTHLSEKYQSLRNSDNGWSIQEAGMAQLDDIVGSVMKYLKDNSLDDNTIIVFTTDNGTENFTWPDGGQTPFAGGKGTALEGGFRAPCILSWPGKVPADTVQNGIFSGLDWFPTFVAAAGNPNIAAELLKGKELLGKTYKVHLDGYNQMDLITGKGPSARSEIFYFTESTLGAVRIKDFKYRFTDQPGGWLGATEKVDWPILCNLRLDPFERTGMFNGKDKGSLAYYDWFVYEFWRFVFVQQEVGKAAQTFLEYPPMQAGASFNMSALKAELEKKMEAMKSIHGQ